MLKKSGRQGNTNVATLVLAFALLGWVSPQLSAFCQATNQEEIARKIKARVEPRYPALARQLKLSGKVKIEVRVSPDGRVKATRVLGGSPVLANAALDAVRMWRYETSSKETAEIVELDFRDPQN